MSGGEKRVVAIASVLSLHPPILVLDEPLAHLDWESARKVREVLLDLHKSGTTIVVIEQRVGKVLGDATRCVVMDRGKIVFDGASGEALPILMEEHLIPHYPAAPKPDNKIKPILFQASSLSREIEGRPVLQEISLAVNEGEIVAIVGKNGAGKTTLIKHFNGLYRSRKANFIHGERDSGNLAPRNGVADRPFLSESQ